MSDEGTSGSRQFWRVLWKWGWLLVLLIPAGLIVGALVLGWVRRTV